ncbi:MAG: hypothetical protein TQ37_04155 [Candidatus Synechococcus spongiarum 15L]|uniref:Uncharacterized protein n=1 Tax=Candidatus Synechococcus spongiarum 15L TaxID=1608419 RepID=A0A0G8AWR9_9SYNE|nr:MAG: hypothetical protein TQ37_04155 [Candidatus Synechococcus spongiarum 15L]
MFTPRPEAQQPLQTTIEECCGHEQADGGHEQGCPELLKMSQGPLQSLDMEPHCHHKPEGANHDQKYVDHQDPVHPGLACLQQAGELSRQLRLPRELLAP